MRTYLDYTLYYDNGVIVFEPLTPRAIELFAELPLDTQGRFAASNEADVEAMLERLDEAGLADILNV